MRELLTENTKITTNVKTIISLAAAAVGVVWMFFNLNIRISQIETANVTNSKEIVSLKAEVDRNRLEHIKQIDDLRTENNSQHAMMSASQDRIINILLNKGR